MKALHIPHYIAIYPQRLLMPINLITKEAEEARFQAIMMNHVIKHNDDDDVQYALQPLHLVEATLRD